MESCEPLTELAPRLPVAADPFAQPGVRRPNFLVIGAAKAGTTALCDMLGQHPEVYVPSSKEPHYFSFYETLEDGSEIRHSPFRRFDRSIKTAGDYAAMFAEAGEATALGEGSVSYLYWPGAAERIHAFDPEMKFIIVLREPVGRAYSSYTYLRGWGFEDSPTLSAGIEREAERTEAMDFFLFRYVAMGQYCDQLRRYFALFPRSQFLVVLYDDFKQRREEVLRDAFEFLGVDPDFRIEKNRQSNVTFVPRESNPVHRMIVGDSWIKSGLRAILPRGFARWLRYEVRKLLFDRPTPLSAQERAGLLPLFERDIRELQGLIDRDLSGWLKPTARGR